jgi:hypothetical protein
MAKFCERGFVVELWTMLVACNLLLLLATQAEPSAGAQVYPSAQVFPSAAAALQPLLAQKPRVVSFGEYHQLQKTAHIASALRRFTDEILPDLHAAGATHLVVETWVTTGSCGEPEHKAMADVAKTTQRPAATENELVTLLRRAKEDGIKPGILEVDCKDYRALTQGKAGVDYDRLLRLTREQLQTQIRAALAQRGAGLVVSYGGAIHNDVQPRPETANYAFGDAFVNMLAGRYLEVDLYVPEFIERDKSIRREPWYLAYRRAYRPGAIILLQRGPHSFVLVFPRSS